jgi:HAD superfamily hydrolase (TIGR01509 family)
MSVKAVIFDMDGVLIDAKEWHYEALNQALGLFGHEISRHDHLNEFDGLPTKTKLNMLSNRTSLSISLHSFINEMKQEYTRQILRKELVPNPAHWQCLARLKRDGMVVGVASNSIKSTITEMMDRAGLSQFLDFTLSNEDVENPKPSPEIYRKAIQLAKTTPDQCLVLEDHPFGWAAAEGAGANIMKVGTVEDVCYENVRAQIDLIEESSRQRNRRAA